MRIALVNQRYGLEVNGGSEYYTRQLAEHLSSVYDVEILTTKALNYDTWENYYEKDIEIINGITVRRFKVEKKRNVTGMRIYGRLQRCCPVLKKQWEKLWIKAQGPYTPQLIDYIKLHQDEYKMFIFVTYLYYHSVCGIPEVAGRAFLIPTAHDEPYIYFSIYKDVFTRPKGLIYLTPEEKELVEKIFPVSGKPHCVSGSGVELPEKVDSWSYREKYQVFQNYIIYVGRIDPNKGCGEMFQIFRMYKDHNPDSDLQLVLAGKAFMEIPKENDIIYHDFVSEEDKFNAISGAKALWLPSQYESLSIAVLEAMSLGVPCIVNGRCEVLKGHCVRSRAGVFYYDYEGAVACLDKLLSGNAYKNIDENARRYVRENYQWDVIVNRIRSLINSL